MAYKSPGVMRFLQIEWHNHERARNAWDIERAEMKAKIAKQEGEVRSSKKINEQLERQIKMLEMALRNERSKARDKASAEPRASGDTKMINGPDVPPEKTSKLEKRTTRGSVTSMGEVLTNSQHQSFLAILFSRH